MTIRTPRLAPDASGQESDEERAGREHVEGVRTRDVVMLLAVPAILLVTFALPDPVRESFVLSDSRSGIALLVAHFVHRTPAHLLGNLAAYLLVAGTAYRLSVLAGRRSDFVVAFGVFLVAFPPVLSATSAPLVDVGVVFGFSGVLTAFLGFLPVTIASFLHSRLGDGSLDHAPALFFLGLALVSFQVVPDRAIANLTTGLALLSAAIYVVPSASRNGARRLVRVERFDLVIGAVAVFGLVLFGAFPTDPVRGTTVVNVYVHLLGYGLGFVSTYVALVVASAIEDRSVAWLGTNA